MQSIVDDLIVNGAQGDTYREAIQMCVDSGISRNDIADRLLLKTLFSLYTRKIEVVWRRGRAWRRKKYHWRSSSLQSLYVWDVPEKETKQLRSEWVALISPFGPTNQCKKDSIDRWNTSTEVCTLALSSKLLVSSSKKRTPGHMALWRCVGWSGDMATTGLRSCQIA